MKNILIVDDEKLLRWSLSTELKELGFNVYSHEFAEEGYKIFKEKAVDICVLDIRLPDYSGIELLRKIKQAQPDTYVIMITAFAEVETAVEALKLGAFDYLIKPFSLEKLKHLINKIIETNDLKKEITFLKQKEQKHFQQERMLSENPEMKKIFDLINKLADIPISTVIITGETGTGKSLIARSIHYKGLRQSKPFVEINCSAISESLLESELFGHEKGAFTNAIVQKKGLVEIADGGTLFLDEIGEMSLPLQSKLLKVIEDKVFKRVGGVKDISVDAQIIAATNKDLQKEIKENKFREDLYFRLNVIPIHIPPLRDRIDDIIILADHFISHYNSIFKKKVVKLSDEACELMKNYAWPGNVRELKNVIERAILLESSEYILADHLHLKPGPNATRAEALARDRKSLNASFLSEMDYSIDKKGIDIDSLLTAVEKKIIQKALEMSGGNQSHTARLLGLNRDTFRYKMKKLEIIALPQHADDQAGEEID
ncbi:MAG TPA: sigma-54 dependent transcriptional regulator [Candidatus Wallbacteria bacterium]|nr:MAG: Transcriptional regulatory protein ZraR [bacterium ADurb.Bin243]HPG58428.1 sigma-54 dependent transcriptional regulator [Candidatus Wallbacteria bacterium]